MCDKYNGWTNRETWLSSLFIDGNYDGENVYKYYRAMAKKHSDHQSLAIELEEHFDELLNVNGQPTVWFDLLRTAVGRINFYEIAESLMEE